MPTTVSGSYPAVNSDSDATINGLTVGKGGGAVASNTTFGASALASNSTGTNNTAIGNSAMLATTGSNNVGVGDNVLRLNSSGGLNTAIGNQALYSNTTANFNTAVGYQAAYSSTVGRAHAFGYLAAYSNTGEFVTAFGYQALRLSTGGGNVAFGHNAASSTTTGGLNTVMGHDIFVANTTGSNNVAMGTEALRANTTGSNNTAIGLSALISNTTASNNTAVGYQAGFSNTTGGGNSGQNTFIGDTAGYSTTSDLCTFVGRGAGSSVTSGRKNTILGTYNGNQGGLDIRTASNYIVLSDGDGNPRGYFNNNGTMTVTANASGDQVMYVNNTTNSNPYGIQCTFLGATPNNTTNTFFIGADSTNSKVILYSSGTINNRTGVYGTISDIKLKQDIVDASSQWDDIKAVRVRKFRLKDDVAANPDTKPLIGVIAQELEQTSAGLIDDCVDKEGDVTKSVKYSILYMKAIKALQEAMERIETLEAKVTALENK